MCILAIENPSGKTIKIFIPNVESRYFRVVKCRWRSVDKHSYCMRIKHGYNHLRITSRRYMSGEIHLTANGELILRNG